MAQAVYIAVIGGSDIGDETAALAREVGREVAARGAVLLCGGLGGVMAAAAQGAQDAGGVSLGILPEGDRRRANPYLTYSIATNLGHARNVLIAHSADALIAVGGSYGTVSEAAIALKLGKPVIALNVTWDLAGVKRAATPAEAVALAMGAMGRKDVPKQSLGTSK
ncbi:MAG: TIGR00725 family protein [Deltaproteobacteria bacterium]|nr:TIGR00725 family protein [Deltaproteobacteria bacterium]